MLHFVSKNTPNVVIQQREDERGTIACTNNDHAIVFHKREKIPTAYIM
uniref:Uncharacterized protein n=1 Tax=Rhizophora mucronata TaxID=61149 RepID=A0A2P2IHP5_RHIMU